MRTWEDSMNAHRDAIGGLVGALHSQWDPAVTMLVLALTEGHKILICGNGGCSALASHLAAELAVRFMADRKAYHAISLSNAVILTAAGTDYGFQRVFSRQIEAYGAAGDVLIACATTRPEPNINEAVIAAKFRGMPTLGLSGRPQLGCDVDIVIPSLNSARCQELMLLVGHLIIEGLEERLPK
jgi:D-sedoheptulose 7-phosphate isomerase